MSGIEPRIRDWIRKEIPEYNEKLSPWDTDILIFHIWD